MIFDGLIGQGFIQPGIESTAMQSENATHGLNRKFVSMVMNEGVLYAGSLAKYFAAFFKMSRSSVIRFRSALRRALSTVRSALLACRGLGSPYFL